MCSYPNPLDVSFYASIFLLKQMKIFVKLHSGTCFIGYTGMLCELKLDLCSHSQYCITKQASSCIDRGDNVTCTCAEGWAGSNCGVNIDDCVNHKCVNGAKCVDKVNGYLCKCKKGYQGNYCEGSVLVLFFLLSLFYIFHFHFFLLLILRASLTSFNSFDTYN